MSLYNYTDKEQTILVKSVSLLNNVYQKDNTLYWRQDYLSEGTDVFLSVDLDWMRVEFNQPLPEGVTEHSFSTSYNLQSMIIMHLAAGNGWDRYPISTEDIKGIISSIIRKVDFLAKESPDIIIKDLGLESLIKDYQYWPKADAVTAVTAEIKNKMIKALQGKVEKAIKDAEI